MKAKSNNGKYLCLATRLLTSGRIDKVNIRIIEKLHKRGVTFAINNGKVVGISAAQ